MPFLKRRRVAVSVPVPFATRFAMSEALDPDGRPFLVRANVALEPVVGHPSYPYRVGVSVLDDTRPADELERLEHALRTTFERERTSVLALVLSARSFLEFVFYSGSPATARLQCERVAAAFPAAGLDVYTERDPDWITYRELRG